ncbi:histidine kinase [Chryseobacterium nematophagum]|uniref:Histidine kinase n=1 Tax=Chryseobacterium nematophagum TaxID=2305228 RepID=A0A3M7TFV6_9FLAO|nr:FIST N-terminal domain-containing protein [Chryseobacterium nematophagum]RNA61984.1 histidine kinase [Chryseobacterium nematophagum]
MKVAKLLFINGEWKSERNDENLNYQEAQLVLGYGARNILENHHFFSLIKEKFPNANIALSSSSGEIFCNDVYDDSVTVTAISFSTSHVETSQIDIEDFSNSYEAGKKLIESLPMENLKWVFVLSDGSSVNGSQLVQGLNASRPDHVLVSGGLAGDGDKFEKTVVGLDQPPAPNKIVAIGFYGKNLELSHSSFGGWESFGLERTVTQSHDNILYEIDNKNALDLYKKYLGKYAEELPSSALLFPLSLKLSEDSVPIVRTILSINENNNMMIFAGDLPEGSKVRFMRANMDRIIDAANDAANECLRMSINKPKLGIIISCVGRKLVLGDRVPEEVEMVRNVFEANTVLTGFYSYGEISPLKPFENCALHNQTITITTVNEIE